MTQMENEGDTFSDPKKARKLREIFKTCYASNNFIGISWYQ